MPITLSSLQNDRIMHTKCFGVLTDQDLIRFYREFFAAGLQEKYFCELIDGSKISTFAITPQSQLELKELIGGFFQQLVADVQHLTQRQADLKEVSRRYPHLLTNAFCNQNVAELLGLPKNHRIAHPPDDAATILAVLKFFLDRHHNRKVAMYATRREVLEVFHAWEQARRHLGYPVRVFDDLSAASIWLLNCGA